MSNANTRNDLLQIVKKDFGLNQSDPRYIKAKKFIDLLFDFCDENYATISNAVSVSSENVSYINIDCSGFYSATWISFNDDIERYLALIEGSSEIRFFVNEENDPDGNPFTIRFTLDI